MGALRSKRHVSTAQKAFADVALAAANLREEWKALVPKLRDNQADVPGVLPKNATIQSYAARQMAILIFAAEQLVDCRTDLDSESWFEAFEAMRAEHKKGPPHE